MQPSQPHPYQHSPTTPASSPLQYQRPVYAYTPPPHGPPQQYIAYTPPRELDEEAFYAQAPIPVRSASSATHTTFKVNGVQYRPPPRRHVSSNASASYQHQEQLRQLQNAEQELRKASESTGSSLSSSSRLLRAMRRVSPAPATAPRRLSRSPRPQPAPVQYTPGPARRPSPTPPPIPSSPAAGSYTSSTYSSPSWGSLFHPSPSRSQPPIPTPKLSRLLTSIATYLTALAPESESVVTREKLAHYYAAFSPHPAVDHRGAYLGAATHRGLERLWSWMGCTYYLIPTEQGELRPALTTSGFVAWSTIQLLLCPDLEVGVIDNLLRQVELRDPETPSICWPRGMEREAVGGVDPVAGEKWAKWWTVLLQEDDGESEVEMLRRRVRELEDEAKLRGEAEDELERLTREIMAARLGEQSPESPVDWCIRCRKQWCECPEEDVGRGRRH